MAWQANWPATAPYRAGDVKKLLSGYLTTLVSTSAGFFQSYSAARATVLFVLS
jgi:hypothetical protein